MNQSYLSTCTLCRHAFFVVALLLFANMPASAQFNSAVQGTVQDNIGSVIASATVTLTNVDNRVSQTATANGSGVYRFSSLAPGNYSIAVAASGFSPAQTAFTLSTAETRDVPITLSIGLFPLR